MENQSTNNDKEEEFTFVKFVSADKLIQKAEKKFKKLKLKRVKKSKEKDTQQ